MKRNTTISRSAIARTIVVSRLRRLADTALFLFLAMLLFWSGAALAQTAPTFNSMILADFNHDGIPDVLTPSATAGNFNIAFGAVPYGTFSSNAVLVPYPANCSSSPGPNVSVGDFNGDGIPDLAITCQGGTYSLVSLTILLGHGDGTFTALSPLGSFLDILVGDFNKDGKLDVVTQGSNDGVQELVFYPGNGDGTFGTATTERLGRTAYATGIALDMNLDGYPDLVFGNFASGPTTNSVDVFQNNQDGTFGIQAPGNGTYVPTASSLLQTTGTSNDTTILAGNFFGRGVADIAIVDTGSVPGIFVPQYAGSGNTISFAGPAAKYPIDLTAAVTGNFVSSLSDLLVANGTTLTVYVNTGTGGFNTNYSGLSVASTTALFAAADANGDGHADIYTAATTTTGVNLTVNLVSGSATATSNAFSLPAGNIPITATWPGNINFNGSTANGTQIVNAVASATALTSSLNPSLVGQSVTFTATVSPATQTSIIPTGMVTFMDGTTTLGTGTLTNGVAMLTTSALTAATHTISAVYRGDSIFATSTKTLSQQVNSNIPTITWANPAAITYGTPLSATQLNATATNTLGATIAGTFVYSPPAGTVLNAGTQTLMVTFMPTDTVDYTTATKSVTIVVNQAKATISWTPAVGTITYGMALGAQQLNATATGVGGATVSGNFVYTPAAGTVLTVGRQTLSVVFTSTNTNYVGGTGTAAINVLPATPTLAWATPAPIAYGTPLSATQLDATATGVTGSTLPGAFVYTPAAGAILNPGVQTLSVTFTPTDTVDYSTAMTTVQLTVTDITLTSFTPNTATIGAANTTITITGSGIVSTTVAQINGTAIATTYVNATTLTAVVPTADFVAPGTLLVTLKNAATGSVSASLPLLVSAPAVTATYNGPTSATPGSQPVLNLVIPAYPVNLTATLTLNTTATLASGVTDPNTVFSNNLTTFTFTIPAGTTTIPTIQLQAGTVAETITVPLVLTVNGVNVTPAGLAPVVIHVLPAPPVGTSATLTRYSGILSVTINGYSNTREIVQATFHFVAASGATISTPDFTAAVGGVFATYYATPSSLTAGSSFVYTQTFTVNGDTSSIGSVQVTLTNTQGVSTTLTAQ
jgi:hypothetical protein